MNATNNELKNSLSELEKLIQAAERILVVSHDRVDGDGLGSMLGLMHHLNARNKNVVCYATNFTPGVFHFLPGIEQVTNKMAEVEELAPDLYIMLDIGDVKRSGLINHLQTQRQHKIKVANVDHHPVVYSEEQHRELIDLHIVDAERSATAELIYHYLDHNNHTISRDIATCLLTGILTDTGNFSNKGTTDDSLAVAGELLLTGANLQQITDMVIRNKSVGSLKLWGRALSRLTKDPETGFATTAIRLRDMEECEVSPDAADGISNFLNNLEDATAIIVYREEPDGTIRGSMRTTRDDVDVSEYAKKLGGGGHAKAAGFSITGTLTQTKNGWRVI